jgi:hypothetical protein
MKVHVAVVTKPYSNESLLLYVCSLTLDVSEDCRAPIQSLLDICLEAFMAAELDKVFSGRQLCQMNYKI